MHKMHKMLLMALLLCLMLLLTWTTTALAFEQINTSHMCSFTLNVTEDDLENPGTDVPLAGVTFNLYRIANVNNTANYTLTEAFADCGIDLNAITTAGEMSDAANALCAYITENSVEPTLTAISDTQGTLTFMDMLPGEFLVLGTAMEKGGYAYSFSPVMVALPTLDGNEWVYDQTSDLKMERNERLMDLTVVKSWTKEYGYYLDRPFSIKVDLLCDGEKVSTVSLRRSSGWKYTFTDLSAAHEWTLHEHSVTYYRPTYEEMVYDSNTETHMVINNKYTRGPHPDIPQTGMLWWPVPVLAFGGVMMFAIGWMLNRKGRSNHENP